MSYRRRHESGGLEVEGSTAGATAARDHGLRWASFPYEPLDSPVYRTGACESARHSSVWHAARFLELLYSMNAPGEMIIREAWFTCGECHEAMQESWREDGIISAH